MTKIAIQGGKVVLRDGKVGTGRDCCCEDCDPPCRRCNAACLEVTFSDFSGTVDGCDCANLNGTYVLTRGTGYIPRLRVNVVDAYGAEAVITVTLALNAANGTYTVSTAAIVNAGSGYSGNVIADVVAIDGVIACNDPPQLLLTADRIEPPQPLTVVLRPDVAGGRGAGFSIAWQPENTTAGQETWRVDSLTINRGGVGYKDRDTLRLFASDRVLGRTEGQVFVGLILVERQEPVIDEFSVASVNGSGATFSNTWLATDVPPADDDPVGANNDYWYIDTLSIVDGGTGYEPGDIISYTLSGPHQTWLDIEGPYQIAEVGTVDGSGAITSLNFNPPENLHIKSTGAVGEVIVQEAGEYYGYGGIESVEVLHGGTIWPSDPCVYSLCQPVECENAVAKCRQFFLTVTQTTRTLVVVDNSGVVYSAELPAENNPCDELTFTAEDAEESACTVGTAVVTSTECGEGPEAGACCEPGPEDCEQCSPDFYALWVDTPSCGPADVGCESTNNIIYGKHCNLEDPTQTSDLGSLDFGPVTGFSSAEFALFQQQGNELLIVLGMYVRDHELNDASSPQTTGISKFFCSRVYSLNISYLGCEWYVRLYSANTEAQIEVQNADIFERFGVQQKNVGLENPPAGFPVSRDYCIAGSGESLTITMRSDGVLVGTQDFTFAADGNPPFEFEDNADLLPDYSDILQPATVVIRPRVGCQNPLP